MMRKKYWKSRFATSMLAATLVMSSGMANTQTVFASESTNQDSTPVETTYNAPTEAPSSAPAETVSETSVSSTPVETTVETSAEATTETSVETSNDARVEETNEMQAEEAKAVPATEEDNLDDGDIDTNVADIVDEEISKENLFDVVETSLAQENELSDDVASVGNGIADLLDEEVKKPVQSIEDDINPPVPVANGLNDDLNSSEANEVTNEPNEADEDKTQSGEAITDDSDEVTPVTNDEVTPASKVVEIWLRGGQENEIEVDSDKVIDLDGNTNKAEAIINLVDGVNKMRTKGLEKGQRKIQVGDIQYNINTFVLYQQRFLKVKNENASQMNDEEILTAEVEEAGRHDLRVYDENNVNMEVIAIPGFTYRFLGLGEPETDEFGGFYVLNFYYVKDSEPDDETTNTDSKVDDSKIDDNQGVYILEIEQGDASTAYAVGTELKGEEGSKISLLQRMYLEKDDEKFLVYCVEPEVATFEGTKYKLDLEEIPENRYAALVTAFLEQTRENDLDDALAKTLVWQSIESEDSAYKNAVDNIIAVNRNGETILTSELSDAEKAYLENRRKEIDFMIQAYESKLGAGFTLEDTENAKMENGVLTVVNSDEQVVIKLKAEKLKVLEQYTKGRMKYPDGVTGSVEGNILTLTIDTKEISESGVELLMSMISENVPTKTLRYKSKAKQTLMQFGIEDPLIEKLLIKRIEKQKPEDPKTPDTPDTPDQPETPETPENPTPDTPENPTPENPQPTPEQPPVTPEFPTPELPPVTPVVPVFEVPTTPETPDELPELPEFVAVLGATRVEAPAEAPADEDHGAVLGATRTESLGDIQTGDNSDMVRYLGTGSIGILLLCGWMLTKRRRAKKA